MLHYILQTIVFQLLFLMVYDVFLKKETFFNWNRFYLLASALLSIVLPFVKIDRFNSVIPKEYIYSLPEIIIGSANNTISNSQEVLEAASASNFVFSWMYVLYLGCAIAFVLFTIKFYKLVVMAYRNPKVKFEKAFIVELANSKHAFSFFNYIFLGKEIKTEDRETIVTHELQHVNEKHSLDLLFFEVLKILFWFNPLIYIYQKRISNLHEFIADSKTVKTSSKVNYYQNLLSQVFDTKKVSFINPFFKQSLIKKRIIMLSKSKSKQIHLAKYLLIIPMVVGMLFYTSCSQKIDIDSENLKQYSYSLQLGEEMPEDVKIIHARYETFLKENKNYVSWSLIDETTEVISYSIHKKEEERPMKMEEILIDFPDGSSYISFINFYNVTNEKGAEIIEYQDDKKGEIPFATIDQVPVFPGCDSSMSNKDQKACFSQNINKLVAQNFNLDLGKILGLEGKQRIYTRFTINKEGNIVDIKSRAPHPELEKEAIRVVNLIPQLQPGKQDGKAVSVAFDLPITFKIQE